MLGSGWDVGSNGMRSRLRWAFWSWVYMVWLPVHKILSLASNTLSLSTMMPTIQKAHRNLLLIP